MAFSCGKYSSRFTHNMQRMKGFHRAKKGHDIIPAELRTYRAIALNERSYRVDGFIARRIAKPGRTVFL
jgi:hypothetical protein